MTKDTKTRRALVTGGGKRLGRAMALYLGARGFDVAVHYGSSADAAEETAGEIEAQGRRAVTVRADLMDEEAVQAILPEAAARLGGPVHVLVASRSRRQVDQRTRKAGGVDPRDQRGLRGVHGSVAGGGV